MRSMCTNKWNQTSRLEFGKENFDKNHLSQDHLLYRYTLPSTVQIHPELPTLADHLQRYVVSKDLPIIMYLHGQDGTR